MAENPLTKLPLAAQLGVAAVIAALIGAPGLGKPVVEAEEA